MKVNYIKIGVITAVSLGTIYGTYRLAKYIKSLKDSEGDSEDNSDVTDVKTETAKVTAPKFDGNKTVKLGSKGNEVGAIQMAINNIIDDAKKSKTVPLSGSKTIYPSNSNTLVNPYSGIPLGGYDLGSMFNNASGSTIDVLKLKISGLTKLKVDNDFGNATLKNVKSIMNSDSTTYNKVKQKRKDLATTFSLPNPY